jgi:prevent-host-death family protein
MAMETTSLADAKNRLSELVSAVEGTWERVTITKNGRPAAVLIAVDDLESLTETLAILSDPEAMSAIAEAESGTGELTTGEEMAAIMAKRLGRGAA